MPCGSLPSIAAFTRLGARNASEMVMLTFRMLHPSRFAIACVVAVAFETSSSSQRRPRAIDVTRVARVSDRIGRALRAELSLGRGISRCRFCAVLCHGTRSV